MKHIIDIETWERRDNYNFFRNFHNSWISKNSPKANPTTKLNKYCGTNFLRKIINVSTSNP